MRLSESVLSDWGFVWSPRCYSAFPRLIHCTDKTALIPLLRMTHRIDYCSSPPLCVFVFVCLSRSHPISTSQESNRSRHMCDHSCSLVMSEARPQGLYAAWSWSLDVDSWFTVRATEPRFAGRGHVTSNQVHLSELNIAILQYFLKRHWFWFKLPVGSALSFNFSFQSGDAAGEPIQANYCMTHSAVHHQVEHHLAQQRMSSGCS